MYYKKLISGDNIIEFHNDWMGVETVIVNGCQVCRGTSVWGMKHHFSIIENGRNVRYILRTKVNMNMQVLVDLSRDGKLVQADVLVNFGSKPRKPQNKKKKQGLEKLRKYELETALDLFEAAIEESPRDGEIYFHMACAHSIMENVTEGYECLKKAMKYGLPHPDKILTHDMLAFLRLQDPFEAFVESNFTVYEEIAEAKYALKEEVFV